MSTVHARNRGSRFRSLHADYAVIDFETTGMRDNDAIVEIGVVLLDKDLSVEDTWEALVNPHRLILNTDVHGIKEEHVDRGLPSLDTSSTSSTVGRSSPMVPPQPPNFCAAYTKNTTTRETARRHHT